MEPPPERPLILLRVRVATLVDLIFKSCKRSQEDHRHVSCGPVSLLANDQMSFVSPVEMVFLFARLALRRLFLPKDEDHNIGVLLDGPRLSQVRKLRTLIAGPLFRRAAQLRER